MSEDKKSGEPAVTLLVEFDPILKSIIEPTHPCYAALSQALADGLAELMQTLGIPGEPSVKLHVLEETISTFMNVQLRDQSCHSSASIHYRIYSYVKGSLQTNTESIQEWLRSLVQELSNMTESMPLGKHPLVEFLTYTCLEIIKKQPAMLLGLEQVDALKQMLLEPLSTLKVSEEAEKDQWPETIWLHDVLTKVLQQNISLKDISLIGSVLVSMRNNSQNEVTEELITKLSVDVVELHFPQDLLRKFTTAHADSWHGHLRNVRQTMWQTHGLNLPDMRFVLNEDLRPDSFACKINDVLLFPWIVLPEDRLGLISHFLRQDLSENKACFVHRRAIEQWLVQTAQTSPVLFRSVTSRFPMYRITQVLRMLVFEQLSIRNLVFIMERLLNYRYILAHPSLPMTFEELFPVIPQEEFSQPDHPSYLESFVRIGLKRAISDKYAGKERQLYSYVFQAEPVVERALSACQEYNAEQQPNPPEVQPVFITSIETRPVLQRFFNDILSSDPVLAHQELIPGLHIQLVKRVLTD
jgi:flagellar biosynthesis component FlhA